MWCHKKDPVWSLACCRLTPTSEWKKKKKKKSKVLELFCEAQEVSSENLRWDQANYIALFFFFGLLNVKSIATKIAEKKARLLLDRDRIYDIIYVEEQWGGFTTFQDSCGSLWLTIILWEIYQLLLLLSVELFCLYLCGRNIAEQKPHKGRAKLVCSCGFVNKGVHGREQKEVIMFAGRGGCAQCCNDILPSLKCCLC